jgi:hypothetical protein
MMATGSTMATGPMTVTGSIIMVTGLIIATGPMTVTGSIIMVTGLIIATEYLATTTVPMQQRLGAGLIRYRGSRIIQPHHALMAITGRPEIAMAMAWDAGAISRVRIHPAMTETGTLTVSHL